MFSPVHRFLTSKRIASSALLGPRANSALILTLAAINPLLFLKPGLRPLLSLFNLLSFFLTHMSISSVGCNFCSTTSGLTFTFGFEIKTIHHSFGLLGHCCDSFQREMSSTVLEQTRIFSVSVNSE